MKPASKRRKTAGALTDTDEDDELFLEPEELNQRRDPSFQLAKGRAKAATRLKSRFEDIFAKYEKDFTGVGDEIDLSTGEVVVDNGHLSSMRSMKDWIVDDDRDEDKDEGEDGQENGEEDEQPLPGMSHEKRPESANGCPRDPQRISESRWPSDLASGGPPALGSLFSAQFRSTNQSPPLPLFSCEPSASADPTWQAPELPPSAFRSKTHGPKGRHYGGTTQVVTRTVLRRSLRAPGSTEVDDEDDLHTRSGDAPQRQESWEPHNTGESPLLHKKFPTADSSPQDNGLNDLIQDVIENIPDTPPSIRRPRVPKSQGRSSPLRKEHQIRSGAKSKLRTSDTPLHGDSRGSLTKRRTKHKAHADSIKGEPARSIVGDQGEQSSWEESDLDSFLDITSQGISKPVGQILYVDIRADHQDQMDSSTRAKLGQTSDLGKPKPHDKFERNVVDPAFTFSDEEILLPKKSKKRGLESMKHRMIPSPSILIASKQKIADEHRSAAENDRAFLAQGEAAARCQKKTSTHERARADSPMLVGCAEMDVEIPECSISDYVTGLGSFRPAMNSQSQNSARIVLEEGSGQRGIGQRRPRGRPRAASLKSLPTILSHSQGTFGGQNSCGKNVAGERHVYSDQENLPSSSTAKRGIRSLDASPTTEGIPFPTERAPGTLTSNEQPVIAPQMDNKNIAGPEEQRRRPVRSSIIQDLATRTTANKGETPVSNMGTEQPTSGNVGREMDLGTQGSQRLGQRMKQPLAEPDNSASRSPRQSPARLAPQEMTVKAMKTDEKARAHNLRAHPQRSSQHQLPAVPERSLPLPPQPAQPATPPRPRSKRGAKKTPSFSTSVMSLLSDSDDDEDELSFTHSDFTPSGHHRILVHRPFPTLPTTPRSSTSSTKRDKRASLLQGRSHSVSSHRISKTPRTPRSTGLDGAGNASHKRKHRKSRPLARSVIRVSHHPDSDVTREGSVLQTPGGSKRRCGVEGWKCERDFCFVCME